VAGGPNGVLSEAFDGGQYLSRLSPQVFADDGATGIEVGGGSGEDLDRPDQVVDGPNQVLAISYRAPSGTGGAS